MKKAITIAILIIIISVGAIGGYLIYLELQRQQTSGENPPNAPTILTSSQTIHNHSLFVSWTSVSNADSYRVYRDGILVNSSVDTHESVYFSGNGTYAISVTAINETGESSHSNSITITVSIIPSSSKDYVRIYVNSTIYGSLITEVNQYKQDIINQGYVADVINWSDSVVENLKYDLIISQNSTFVGAVLVGDLPYALYNNGSTFPCDLYLMDLDGLWGDLVGPDGIYDSYIGGTGDVYPEIWVGRINPESLNNLGFSHIQAYKDYFKKNHDYRTGNLIRPHTGLLYVDDDWTPWNSSWYTSMANSYSNITHIGMNSTTKKTDYETRLTNSSYEFVHAMIHSFPYQHQFGPFGDGSQGITTYSDINSIVTQPLFYNLFCCSACDYRTINSLGTQYLFSNNTLAVIGSTKTGGMWVPADFYTPLGQGKTIGESFRLWWWNGLHGPLDSDSQGMCILGDPLLTI